MNFDKKDKFDDYSEALDLFKTVYLYDGYRNDLSEYANSYIGRGEKDIVRNDLYSKCVEYTESGTATWKIVSPKNIFGLELEHSVNHNNHNSISSSLILNSGRYDLNRIISRFASIDVTGKTDQEITTIVETILGMTNEEVISNFNIKDNPNSILSNAIILDVVLNYLKTQNNNEFPSIICNAENGNIIVTQEDSMLSITNQNIQYNNQMLNYSISGKFPNSKFEVDGIRGDNQLFGMISNKFIELNNKDKDNLLMNDILDLALKNRVLKQSLDEAKQLYGEYLEFKGRNDYRDNEENRE